MKTLLHSVITAVLLFSAQQISAQHQAEEQIFQQYFHEHPEKLQALRQQGNQPVQPQSVLVIPVVFHVVYVNANQNIPDSCLLQQIDVLNEDFRKQNADTTIGVNVGFGSLIADCELEFCLASLDPNGNPTNGMLHVQAPSSQSNVTTVSPIWDPTRYLNVWVCNLSNGLLGFTQFPGVGPSSTDGISIHYRAIGKSCALAPYNKGRTLTHEIGHWLGLYHVTGNQQCTDSDGISDTPTMASSGPFTCCGVQTDFCQPTAPGVMYMNFMCSVYTGDDAICMFTPGQKAFMWNTINTLRPGLLTASSQTPCVPQSSNDLSLISWKPQFTPVPSSGIIYVDIPEICGDEVRVRIFDASGRVVQDENVQTHGGGKYMTDLSYLSDGMYFAEIIHAKGRACGKIVLQKNGE